MTKVREFDPTEIAVDPDVTETQPPLSGTVDDDDDVDDERSDENEAPTRGAQRSNRVARGISAR